ncbi:hypothetical protein DAPPUDRAFT_255018 [Daphnia pulex]|uniref:Uncharacterized protein n=1 Tax=Daphnia pulex TaxID=6669 RepID=E9H8E7_DAPPU|nr:hypothetical protein DAPPUDRAFT_255018 [Daphnia pulex]|eukprot:EFX71996.1 hypothetical protein DAPPUDRAFT_255018 [Daphnia pulex]
MDIQRTMDDQNDIQTSKMDSRNTLLRCKRASKFTRYQFLKLRRKVDVEKFGNFRGSTVEIQ